MILERDTLGLDLFTVFMDVNLDPDLGPDGVVGFSKQLRRQRLSGLFSDSRFLGGPHETWRG